MAEHIRFDTRKAQELAHSLKIPHYVPDGESFGAPEENGFEERKMVMHSHYSRANLNEFDTFERRESSTSPPRYDNLVSRTFLQEHRKAQKWEEDPGRIPSSTFRDFLNNMRTEPQQAPVQQPEYRAPPPQKQPPKPEAWFIESDEEPRKARPLRDSSPPARQQPLPKKDEPPPSDHSLPPSWHRASPSRKNNFF
jgi:hypothetical protein